MSKLERLPKRPPAIARRASGPSLCSDSGSSGGGASGEYASSNVNALISPALPLSDRSNRGAILSEEGHDSSTGLSLAYRSAALSSGHGGMKMARSASSSVTPSTDMSLVQNNHSTASTASPLITPSDDAHLQDPLLAATSHGSLFELKRQRKDHTSAVYEGKQAQAPATSMESAKESSVSIKQRQAQHRPKPQGRDRSAGGSSSSTTKGSEAEEKAWSEVTSTPASWADSSLPLPLSPELAAQVNARPHRQPEEQRNDRAGSSHKENNYIDQELSLLAQGMSMEQSPKPVLPSRSSTARPTDPHNAYESINLAQYHDSSPTALSSMASAQQSAYPLHPPLPPTYHRESMPQYAAYVGNRGGGSEALTNAYNRTTGMEPVPFEAFRSTPDPYAPMYGLPPPSMSSTSTPQSPTFGGHHHQLSSDSAIFMYPGPYPQALPSIPSQRMQHVIPANPQDITAGTHMGNGRLPSGVAAPMMMQGVNSYGPQSPIMVTTAPSHLQQANRRGGNLHHQGGMPVMDPGFTASSQWPHSPSNYSHHAHSPTLSGHYDVRPAMGMSGVVPSTGGGGHHRVLSTHQAFPVSAMMFAPGSISPPSPFIRAQGQGRMGLHSRSPSSFSQFSQQRSAGSDAQRSPLLEDFRSRNNKGRHFELSDIRGHLLEFSSDQYGSRFAQEKLDTATDEERKMVFDELFPHSLTLMTDVFGNYVIQKLFQHGTDDMRLRLVNQLEGHVLTLSLGTYGCRVVQRALEYIKNEDQIRIANELRLDILTCARDQNANHVIQKILERISPTSQIDFIPSAFRGNVYTLAAHCYSCRVLQRIFQHCDEAQHRPLIDELLGKAEELMHDQYGNYVIQWILQNASKPDQDVVIRLAKGNVMRLSRHKFASNVMEQVVRAASQEERYSLIEESLVPMQDGTSHDLQPGAILMMKDQYANYVLQRFLELSDGLQKARLISVVKPALHNMKRFSNGFAKHLSAIERLLDTTVTRSNAGTMTSISNVGHERGPTT